MDYNLDIEKIAAKIDFEIEDVLMLVEVFLETANESLEELKNGINTNDMEKIFVSAHSIKGSSSTLQLHEISNLAKEIELQSRANNDIDYMTKYEELLGLINSIKGGGSI